MKREDLDIKMDHLEAMLPPWLSRSRHDLQFWPQFNVLAEEILSAADTTDRLHFLYRIHVMLAAQGLIVSVVQPTELDDDVQIFANDTSARND